MSTTSPAARRAGSRCRLGPAAACARAQNRAVVSAFPFSSTRPASGPIGSFDIPSPSSARAGIRSPAPMLGTGRDRAARQPQRRAALRVCPAP